MTLNRRTLLVGLGVLAVPLDAFANTVPPMRVHKDPNCSCCAGWVDHVRSAGFEAEMIETAKINAVKARLGVPSALASCHTAEIGGFVLEGHVPADEIRRLLTERPQATGLAVPRMPVGSPGMEVPDAAPDTYEVILFGPAGRSVYARYKGAVRI